MSGTIKDYEDKPIKKVRIFIDSLKTKVKSDKNGAYKILVSNENKLITAFSEKHGVIDIDYNGEKKINFIFPKDEVTITKKELWKMGYGISNYSSPLIDYSSYTDIFQLLRTRFQNVKVIGEDIRIKGAGSSLSNGGDFGITPIFTVNGSQVFSISRINPADIKSISVNRATSSLYGSRGAGGIIKIVLKK